MNSNLPIDGRYRPHSLMRLALSVVLCLASNAAYSKEIIIKMENQGRPGVMVFEPDYIAAAVGDTIRFIPTDPGHNAEPIAGMLPDGVDATTGQMNKEYAIKLSRAGYYGIKCSPHFSFGMVALIKAGRGPAPNTATVTSAVAQLPVLAKRRLQGLLAQSRSRAPEALP